MSSPTLRESADIVVAMNDLASYPRPHLAVDLVVLVVRDSLGVVVVRGSDTIAALPGRFVRERRTVDQTVREIFAGKLGLDLGSKLPPITHLGVYDAPHRDERSWVVSVSHVTSLRPDEAERLDPDRCEILPIRGDASRGRRVTRERLAYDHDEMVTTAVRRTRRRYERSPDPLRLLRAPYTMSELRRAHEAVLGAELKRDTFNRRMQPDLLPAIDRRGDLMTSDTGGRPAQLYRPRSGRRADPGSGPFPLPRSR
jgi:8-oxo-dGTP diphosphatase